MLFYPEKCYWIDEQSGICGYAEPCDEFLHSQSIIYSGVTKVQFGNVIVNMIVVDSNFLKLEQNIQDFFIYHEIGHIKYGHNNISINEAKRIIIKRCLGFLPKMEVQADCYAASVVGKSTAKLALRAMITDKQLPFMSRFEIVKRFIKIK